MGAAQSRADRALVALVRRLGTVGSLAFAALLYAGIGLALPLALSWPTYLLIVFNFLGVTLAFLIFIVWLVLGIEEGTQRNILEWTSDVYRLSPTQFELYVAEVFRREGWAVEHRGGIDGPDGNIDLVLRRGDDRRLVQVKRWSAPIGVDLIRGFLGTLLREGLQGKDGIFVTQSNYFPEATAEANQAGLLLVSRRELLARADAVRSPQPCPECGTRMRFGRSPVGYWLYCPRPNCKGHVDLGDDTYKVLKLLTTTRDVDLEAGTSR